jgi:hypothetical protein
MQRIRGCRVVQLAVDREQRDLGADRGARAQRYEQRREQRHELEHQHVQHQLQRIRRDAVLVRERGNHLDEEQAEQRGGGGVAGQHLPGGVVNLSHRDFARAHTVGRGRDRRDDGDAAEAQHAPPAARAEQEGACEPGVVHGPRVYLRDDRWCRFRS